MKPIIIVEKEKNIYSKLFHLPEMFLFAIVGVGFFMNTVINFENKPFI